MDFRQRLGEGLGDLSASERQIADFLLARVEEIPFLSATEVAAELRLSPSGVTRFAQRLGFEGYPHVQRVVRKELRESLSLSAPPHGAGLLAEYWANERRNLEELARLPEEVIEKAVSILTGAETLFVLGARSSEAVARQAAHFFSLARPRVRRLLPGEDLNPEVVLDAGPNDAALVFTIRRYASATTRLARALEGRGAALVLVTDTGPSPLARSARLILRVPTHGVGHLASVAPTASLAHALFVASAQRLGSERLEAAEGLLEAFGTFEY